MAPKLTGKSGAAEPTPATGQRVTQGAPPSGGTAELPASPALVVALAEPAVGNGGGLVCQAGLQNIAVVHCTLVMTLSDSSSLPAVVHCVVVQIMSLGNSSFLPAHSLLRQQQACWLLRAGANQGQGAATRWDQHVGCSISCLLLRLLCVGCCCAQTVKFVAVAGWWQWRGHTSSWQGQGWGPQGRRAQGWSAQGASAGALPL